MSDLDQDPYGNALKRMRECAEKGEKKDYLEAGKEIHKYGYSKDYDFLYQDFANRSPNSDLFFKARVNRASEFVDIVGPYLYPDNPKAQVTPRDGAGLWAEKRARVEQDLLDYIIREGDLDKHMRRAVNHGLIFGRMPVWFGWNAKKKIPQAVFDESCNLTIDPDARSPEEITWVCRKRIKPRYQLRQMYPDNEAVIATLPAYDAQKPGDEKYEASDPATEPVCYYEWYLSRGLHHYSGKVEPDQGEDGQPVDEPLKYVESNGKVLYKGPWDIPYFRDAMWPVVNIDLCEWPGRMWPRAPMEPGLGHLKALNWIYTLYLSKMRFTTRTPLAIMSYNGQGVSDDDLIKYLSGADLEILKVTVNGNESLDIGKLIQQLKLDSGVDDLERFVQLVGKEFENATGLGEILRTGQTQTQIRSTGIADMMERAARGRVDEMRRVVERGMSDVLRHLLFLARFIMTPEEVGAILGPDAASVWGNLGTPEDVAMEQEQRAMLMQQLTAPQPPTIDPMTGMLIEAPVVTPEQADEQLGPPQFVDFDMWMREADREVEAGSMRRSDPQLQSENVNLMLNQVAPSIIATPGGPAMVAAILTEFARINRMSPELKAATQAYAQAAMMPPPMPAGPMGSEAGVPVPGAPAPIPPAAGPAGGEPML